MNPETGLATDNTLKALMKTRRIDPGGIFALNLGGKYEPCMGVNATHIQYGTEISIGDKIKVLAIGNHDDRGIWNGLSHPKQYNEFF